MLPPLFVKTSYISHVFIASRPPPYAIGVGGSASRRLVQVSPSLSGEPPFGLRLLSCCVASVALSFQSGVPFPLRSLLPSTHGPIVYPVAGAGVDGDQLAASVNCDESFDATMP